MAETKKTTTATKSVAKTTTKATTTKTTTTKKPATTKKVAEVKETVKVEETVAKKPAKKAVKQLKVTLVKSPIGYNKKQSRVVRALGLNKMNSSHILPDNACVRGMIKTVNHLVKMEELN